MPKAVTVCSRVMHYTYMNPVVSSYAFGWFFGSLMSVRLFASLSSWPHHYHHIHHLASSGWFYYSLLHSVLHHHHHITSHQNNCHFLKMPSLSKEITTNLSFIPGLDGLKWGLVIWRVGNGWVLIFHSFCFFFWHFIFCADLFCWYFTLYADLDKFLSKFESKSLKVRGLDSRPWKRLSAATDGLG